MGRNRSDAPTLANHIHLNIHEANTCSCRVQKRRPHKKSRNGCQKCKLRRVKCDEVKPICGNCTRFSLECDYGGKSSSDKGDEAAGKKRGRPRKSWPALSKVPGSSSPGSANAITSSPHSSLGQTAPASSLNIDDLELFYHYMKEPEVSVGIDMLWKDRIPNAAFGHHCIFHLLLAFAAFHLAKVRPSESARFRQLADSHMANGVRQATELLPGLDKSNAGALYFSAVLTCICTFAKGPCPGQLLVVAEGGEVPWWNLFGGVRFVVENIGWGPIFSSIDAPPPWEQPEDPPDRDEDGVPFVGWEEHLGRLSTLVDSAPAASRNFYQKILDSLTPCFRDTYGDSTQPKSPIVGKFQVIMGWLYRVEDTLVDSLYEKDPVSLVFLAQFAIPLQTLERYWFMEGWALHLIRGILECLDPSYRHWLDWPRAEVERVINSKKKCAGKS